MPKSAEKQIARQGGTARYRTLKKGDKLFTCSVTRKEGPKGGRTVCWPKKKHNESLSTEAIHAKAQRIVDRLLEEGPDEE